MLVALGGLPGSGKSTLARALARDTGAVWLRIDTIEAALRAGDPAREIGPEGYDIAAAIALDNLRLGRVVIADAVNPIPVTRRLWFETAAAADVPLREVLVGCGDPVEHRARVEGRRAAEPGRHLPDWAAVRARRFDPWPDAAIVETAGRTVGASVADLRARLRL